MKAVFYRGFIMTNNSELSGYSDKDFNGTETIGASGYSDIVPNADKIKAWGGSAKKDIVIFKEFTPIFFSQNLRDCTEQVMDNARTFAEIKKEREQERGKPFGNNENDIRELKELKKQGDSKNKGYVKLPLGRGNLFGESFIKYLPDKKILVGTTRETIQGIRKLEAESKYNYEVFEAIYDLVYKYVISEFEQEGETYRHFRRYRFERIKLNRDEIFRKLKWDKNDRWDKLKLKNALYFLVNVKFLLVFLGKKYPLNLSPFIENYMELENGDIIFNVNPLYFMDAEKHINRKLNELEKPEQMELFKKGSLPKYLPELPKHTGETPETRVFKNYLKSVSIESGSKKIEIKVSEGIGKIMTFPKDIEGQGRSIKKLSDVLDELQKEGFIKEYFPRIDRGYGRMKKTLEIILS
jgi:hypothetical protein